MVRLRTAAAVFFLAAEFSTAQTPNTPQQVFGYADFSQQAKWDNVFMAVPDPKLAGQHLKELTKAPHWASSKEDYDTAVYVAQKFKEAGLETKITPYKVLLNKPISIHITATDAHGHQLMAGPTPEHVDPNAYGGDPQQNDPRILPAFNGSSASGDVTADAVYANYGTLDDFNQLQKLGIDVKGKIVLVRYGQNFRGVKACIAQQRGAAGVIIFSDPFDDGYDRGDKYPRGPMRPDSAVQRGSVQFLPLYPGDPETPGIASTPDLPDSKRVTDPAKMNQPSIPVNPLSYKDAAPILEALEGPNVPHDWQGGLPFAYHLGGTGAVKVHMDLKQDYALRTIWDVTGNIDPDPNSKEDVNAWVVAGNHRDAWVYGAVDPNSGTAAMLETVHGLGVLLKQGWKPKRRIIICSWDAEEEGLMGSTEWAEDKANHLAHAVAYFNTDVGVSGPDFNASAVPSLKGFVRDATREVPSPKGGTVYEQWQKTQAANPRRRGAAANPFSAPSNSTAAPQDVRVGDLGSGSDYTPFIQHLGVPSTDIGSDGPYGVYHSTFDDFNWFIRNADPTFVYEQQMARVFGLEILHMADTDVLPYDYRAYSREVLDYITAAQKRAATTHLSADFDPALKAAARFQAAGDRIYSTQSAYATHESTATPDQLKALNVALRDAEEALLNEAGLPKRPWFKHTIYAPGEYTGYAAVVIPGVNEGIDAEDSARTQSQLDALTAALNRSAQVLETASMTPSR